MYTLGMLARDMDAYAKKHKVGIYAKTDPNEKRTLSEVMADQLTSVIGNTPVCPRFVYADTEPKKTISDVMDAKSMIPLQKEGA
jgi:hypothetical protein